MLPDIKAAVSQLAGEPCEGVRGFHPRILEQSKKVRNEPSRLG